MLRVKLLRDLWHLRGQVAAVALVAAVGIANLVMSRATLASQAASRARFNREYADHDAFADLHRAPEAVARQLARIAGVAAVETRVTTYGRAELDGFHEPITVQAVSLPELGALRMNRLHIRQGRMPGARERDAIAASDAFAEAHRLRPGAALTLVLHGRRQRFRIVGIGTSPEFVAQLSPRSVFPDPRRFAIVWMPRAALAAATDMDGAFNSATLALQPGARNDRVIAAIDPILAPYGGVGAIGRADQRSHRYLSEEFRQLATMARLFPAVFLSVAAFVLYVVLGRLVAAQREQIGTLGAFGYRPGELAAHYAGFALVIGLLGAALGVALGLRLGHGMAGMYREFYRLPYVDYTLPFGVLALAVGVSVGSALLGALLPVWNAARLPPAEAIRPEVPRSAGRLVRGGASARWSQAHRLIWRSLLARPLRSVLTCLGLATGTAIMMMARFQGDAIDLMVEQQFRRSERHDVSVGFIEAQPARALLELGRLPGVTRVEGERAVPVRIRFRAAGYRTVVRGLMPGARLRPALDQDGRPVRQPARGVVLTDYLARTLGAGPGDSIELETLDGRLRKVRLPLAGVVAEPFGAQAYLPIAVLERAFGDPDRVTGAALAVDGHALPRLLAHLDQRPAIAGVDQRVLGIRNFYEGMADTILTFALIATSFGIVVTGGVVYSSARVALSERARDLASLRILGFTTSEVGYLLLGELGVLTLFAVPLGFALGHGLIALLVTGFESDLFRVPHFVSSRTYGLAGATTVATAFACAALIWRRVGHLDLIGVLKARD
jgi:putative ABC transport system permease protein